MLDTPMLLRIQVLLLKWRTAVLPICFPSSEDLRLLNALLDEQKEMGKEMNRLRMKIAGLEDEKADLTSQVVDLGLQVDVLQRRLDAAVSGIQELTADAVDLSERLLSSAQQEEHAVPADVDDEDSDCK